MHFREKQNILMERINAEKFRKHYLTIQTQFESFQLKGSKKFPGNSKN